MPLVRQCEIEDNAIMLYSSDIERDAVVCDTVSEKRIIQVAVEMSRGAEKRPREDSEENKNEDDGYVTVQRKTKRIHKASSDISVETYEIAISSTQILPKQIGLAKLMRAQEIKNITAIKYKGPYKVLITLSNENDAEKILHCQKFVELEYRCHYTNQVNTIYGVVKDVDLDIEEKELLEVFKSETEILSIRRLRRLNEKREWVPSSSVRLGFISSTLPTHISGYGCRFKVEPYTFPVSQCSGCWLFGHFIKFCPSKKIRCPKCGQGHENCDTQEFICLNCKGPHMAMNKQCPIFVKEKKIRDIMCDKNLTYKKALELYCQQKVKVTEPRSREDTSRFSQKDFVTIDVENKEKMSYRDVVTEPYRPDMRDYMSQDAETSESEIERNNKNDNKLHTSTFNKKTLRKKRKRRGNMEQKVNENDCNVSHEEEVNQRENFNKKDEGNIPTCRKILIGLKEILLSNKNIEEKIFDAILLVIEEVGAIFSKCFKGSEMFTKILSFFNG